MLDAILGSHRRVDVDWLHVQRALDRGATRFLAVWMRLVVWLPLFVIFGYGASPDAFRALAVAFLVGVWWLAWSIRAAFGRDQITWRSSLLSWLGLGLGAVVIVIFAAHPASRFDLYLNTGPVAWFGLVGFVLLLSQERALLARLKGRTGIALVALYVATAVYPAVFSYIRGGFSTVPVSVAVSRYVEHGIAQFGLLGAGLGRANEGFWSLAELVDVEQIARAPGLPGAYAALLWEGGPLLLAAFAAFGFIPALYAFFFSRRRLKRLGPESRERSGELSRRRWSLALFGWLVLLAFIPLSFMGLFTAGLLVVLCSGGIPSPAGGGGTGVAGVFAESEARRAHSLFLTTRLRLIPARSFVAALALFGMFGTVSAVRLIAFPEPPDISADSESLSGFDHWLIARHAGGVLADSISVNNRRDSIGRSSGLQNDEKQRLQNDAMEQAAAFYEAALPRLPRNLILRLEASQFYRLVADNPDEAARIAEQGLVVDGTYIPLVLERAAQLAQAGQNEQALALLLPHVSESVSVAYQAGTLSLAAGNAEQAVLYYESAIQQNPNHLQARFELSQAFIALGRAEDAAAQLSDLESRVAPDDFQTRAAITALRGLVEE
ncbi:MAG: tetratricopeptide repeat protein [Parcubacteria group bacterium]|nr:tetratricopeptide repeat protein [Parcubacteria group bacterium]